MSTLEFDIREAVPADARTIADFNARMAEETEGHALDPTLIGPGVDALLVDPAKGRYWLATSGQIRLQAGDEAMAYEQILEAAALLDDIAGTEPAADLLKNGL